MKHLKIITLCVIVSLVISSIVLFTLYAILASSTTCADLARYGIRDIPHGDPHYKLYLDRDKDRVACES